MPSRRQAVAVVCHAHGSLNAQFRPHSSLRRSAQRNITSLGLAPSYDAKTQSPIPQGIPRIAGWPHADAAFRVWCLEPTNLELLQAPSRVSNFEGLTFDPVARS
ncbi:hypothetical protein SCHPADRAFT_948297 [Schizopora paradoxa]|uniref:Uncharacterized protein n=1 Tax=Schizopora paradoxa TaxID=27342 RepID=A0A0H2R2V4_9AGAM|nr:hypothetical protein SCHPADRAFT_948297 [Schizopora paradoxa]